MATGYQTSQWAIGYPDFSSTAIPGATSLTLSFVAQPSMSGNAYLINLTTPTGGRTAFAYLTVNAAPTAPAVTAQPVNSNASVGSTAPLVVAATGFPTASVQWQQATVPTASSSEIRASSVKPASLRTAATQSSPMTFTNVAGATSNTFNAPVTAKGVTYYRAVITNANGSITTQTVKVIGNSAPQVNNDLTTLRASIRAALASVQSCKRSTQTLVTALKKDLARLKATRSQQALVTALNRSEASARQQFLVNERRTFIALLRAASKAVSAAATLKKHPGNATAQASLQAALTNLASASASSTAPADATQCKFSQQDQLPALSAIAPGDTQLQNDLGQGYDSGNAIGQILQAPVQAAQQLASRLANDAQTS